MSLINTLSDLEKLKFPPNHYVIVGSGIMDVLGIRNANDLDILVSKDLWNILIKDNKFGNKIKYINSKPYIKFSYKIEIYQSIPGFNTEDTIKNAERDYKDIPFISLDCLLKWKKGMNRAKDKEDVLLIENYLENK